MRIWHHLRLGLRALLRRDRSDRDLEDEMTSWLAEAEAELVSAGVAPEEARRAVRLRYGDGLAAREDVRGYGWESTLTTFAADLRVAARRLRRDPGFTTVAVLTLALGIGATTAIVSAVRPVLFDPLPYPDADRIVAVSDRASDGSRLAVTFGTYLELSARSKTLDHLSVFRAWQPTLTGVDEAEQLQGQRVSAEYFSALGVHPVLGRGFDAAADHPEGADQVIIGNGLWRARFASDPAIVGRTMQLDSRPFTIVGVMGENFENATAPMAQLWALLQYDAAVATFDSREWGHHLDLLGRVAGANTLDDAHRELNDIAARPTAEFARPAWASMGQGLLTRRLRDAAVADARPTMLVLLGAVSLLLAIACVNLTILLLARGSRRQGELAMRVALGAGRARLARYLLTESLLLAGLGAIAGMIVAALGLTGLVAVSPATLLRLDSISIDGSALLFAIALTSFVAMAFGLLPLLLQSEGRSSISVGASARGGVGRTIPARPALVVAEVAVAVVLLVGAGLLLRSTQRLFAIPPGFDASDVAVLQVSTSGLEPGDAIIHGFFDDALRAVQAVPGVRSAGLTNQLPLSGDVDMYGVTLDEPGRDAAVDGAAYRYAVTPSYLQAMRIDLVRGRALDRADMDDGVRAAVLSESLSRRLYADRDPLGSRLHFGAVDDAPFTVVGVVADVKQTSLGTVETDAVYVTSRQWHWADRVRWFVIRADRDVESLVPAVRAAIRAVDPDQPIIRVQSMPDLVKRSEAQRRFVLMVLAAFALSALALAGVGLCGVMSGTVAERTRELGVRGALGASRRDIVAMVVRKGMTTAVAGIGLGVATALAVSEMLASLLFEISRVDAATYVGVSLLLGIVAALACWIPALRAARVDPADTLREAA